MGSEGWGWSGVTGGGSGGVSVGVLRAGFFIFDISQRGLTLGFLSAVRFLRFGFFFGSGLIFRMSVTASSKPSGDRESFFRSLLFSTGRAPYYEVRFRVSLQIPFVDVLENSLFAQSY